LGVAVHAGYLVAVTDSRLALGAGLAAAAFTLPVTLGAFMGKSWRRFSLGAALVAVGSVVLLVVAISVVGKL
jgi:hypothetical protein